MGKFEKYKKRNSTMEIVRIIAMTFIVLHHYVIHGAADYLNYNSFPGINGTILLWCSLGGKIGCLIFIGITGYYQVYSRFNLARIIKLLAEVQFYALFLWVMEIIIWNGTFSIKDMIRAFLPTIFNQYWFFTAYFVIMVLSPFINKLIKSCKREAIKVFLIITCILWFVIPSFGGSDMFGNSLPLLIMVYILGAYIRIYLRDERYIRIGRFVLYISLFLLLSSVLVFKYLGRSIYFLSQNVAHFSNINSILGLGITFGIILLFSNKTVTHSRGINLFASATFGIYLIHDNRFLGPIIWLKWFNNSKASVSNTLILHILLSTTIVYLGCTIIEIARKGLYSAFIDPHIDKIANKIEQRYTLKFEE